MDSIQEDQLVPVRLGAILRMIRKQQKKGVMKIVRDCFDSDSNAVSRVPFKGKVEKIHHTNWSGYELGTRMPTDESLENLIEVINIFMTVIFQKETPGLKDVLRDMHYKDHLISSLGGVLPLRYIGAMVLANFLHDPKEIETDPVPDHYYINDQTPTNYFNELIYDWEANRTDDPNHNFRVQFAKFLLQENEFNNRKTVGQDKSISDAEKYFSESDNRQASHKDSTWLFCAEALKDGLFFVFPGAAIDAILALSKSIQYVPASGELNIEVYTPEGNTRPLHLQTPM